MKHAKFTDEEENIEEKKENIFDVILGAGIEPELPKSRALSLYADIDEETASLIVPALLSLKDSGKYMEPKDPNDEKCEELIEKYESIKFYISTHGGSAHEMFSIYDMMKVIQKECEIETFGMGKVMSAGVLLLSAGTKGKRKISANCRIMIHPVSAASMGDIHDIENDTKEIKLLQTQYVKALVNETSMTEKYLKSLIRKKVNTYFSAEDAIRLGIVDEIM